MMKINRTFARLVSFGYDKEKRSGDSHVPKETTEKDRRIELRWGPPHADGTDAFQKQGYERGKTNGRYQ